MNPSNSSADILTLVLISAGIYSFGEVKQGRKANVVGIVFGSLALFATLVTLGQFGSWALAKSMAWLLVLVAFLNKGSVATAWMMDFITGLTGK